MKTRQSNLRTILFGSVVILLIYGLLAFAFYTFVAAHVLGANDFYSRWAGARALFLQNQNPYSLQVTQQIQLEMYGRLAYPNEDQVAFAYPLYAAFFVLPFITMPYAWAESFWMAGLILIAIGGALALAHFLDWRFSLFGLLLYVLGVLAFYPVWRGIFLGQFAILVFASIALGLALLKQHYDEVAGWVLAIAMVKPHVAIPTLAIILLWSIAQRRWRVWRGWLSAMILLIGIANGLLPNWHLEFIRAVIAYESYIRIGSPLQVLCQLFLPSREATWATAIIILFLGSLIPFLFARTMKEDLPAFLPTIELAILITTLGMIRTATTDQAILLIPWMHWFSHFARARRWLPVGLLAAILIVLPWFVFLTTLSGNAEAPIATTTVALCTWIAYPIMSWQIRSADLA